MSDVKQFANALKAEEDRINKALNIVGYKINRLETSSVFMCGTLNLDIKISSIEPVIDIPKIDATQQFIYPCK